MNTKYRIKKNEEFDDILNNGRKNNNSYFSLYNKDNNLTYSRFGITLAKKFGNAVERNKYKRIVFTWKFFDIMKNSDNHVTFDVLNSENKWDLEMLRVSRRFSRKKMKAAKKTVKKKNLKKI